MDDITVTYKTQPKFSARYKNLPDISKESLVLMKITEKAVMSIVEDNNLGEHPITWRMYDKELNSKYEFVITKQGICNITAASIVVKILGASKVKGSADPKLYYEIVEGKEFLNETSIKGELVRVEGEGSGKYLICADNLDAGEKFVIVIDNSDGDNYLYIKPNYLNVTLTIIASILGGCGIVILCAVCYFIKRKRRRDFLNN